MLKIAKKVDGKKGIAKKISFEASVIYQVKIMQLSSMVLWIFLRHK